MTNTCVHDRSPSNTLGMGEVSLSPVSRRALEQQLAASTLDKMGVVPSLGDARRPMSILEELDPNKHDAILSLQDSVLLDTTASVKS